MSNLTVKGNASGTGTVILEAPNTNSNRTITLPDSTSTLATTAQVDAISSIVHLGTIATTSGSSVTLSGLTLTSYKQLQFFAGSVSGDQSSTVLLLLNGVTLTIITNSSAAQSSSGGGVIDLASGIFFSSFTTGNGGTFSSGGASGLTTASTSITFTCSAGTFDAGSIRIYGVK